MRKPFAFVLSLGSVRNWPIAETAAIGRRVRLLGYCCHQRDMRRRDLRMARCRYHMKRNVYPILPVTLGNMRRHGVRSPSRARSVTTRRSSALSCGWTASRCPRSGRAWCARVAELSAPRRGRTGESIGRMGRASGNSYFRRVTPSRSFRQPLARVMPINAKHWSECDSDLFRPGIPTRSRPGFRDEAGRLAAVGGVFPAGQRLRHQAPSIIDEEGLMPARRELTMRQLR
jgi:hypothetical protein